MLLEGDSLEAPTCVSEGVFSLCRFRSGRNRTKIECRYLDVESEGGVENVLTSGPSFV